MKPFVVFLWLVCGVARAQMQGAWWRKTGNSLTRCSWSSWIPPTVHSSLAAIIDERWVLTAAHAGGEKTCARSSEPTTCGSAEKAEQLLTGAGEGRRGIRTWSFLTALTLSTTWCIPSPWSCIRLDGRKTPTDIRSRYFAGFRARVVGQLSSELKQTDVIVSGVVRFLITLKARYKTVKMHLIWK